MKVAARVLAIVLASASALVAACSDESSPPPAPVVVGVLAPVEGGLVDFGRGIADSVRLAVAEQAPTILPGRDVRVLVRDDASDPEKGALAAAELAADPLVAAVVGPYNSGVAQAALPVLSPAGLALVSPSNTLTSLTRGGTPENPTRPWPTYFRLVGADVEQAVFLARRAREIGYGRAAVVSETKAVSKGLADDFVAAFRAGGGVVTVRSLVPDDARDFEAFLAEAIPTEPDLVFFGGEYPVAATLRVQASAAGLDVPVMGGDGIKDQAYWETAGRLAIGTLASTVGVPVEKMPGGPAFLASWTAAGFANAPSAYGPYAYDAAVAVMRAIAAAVDAGADGGDGLRAGVVEALATTDFEGVTGRVRFDDLGDPVDPVFTLYRVDGNPLAWVEWR